MPSTADIISGIKNRDSNILKFIYSDLFPLVERLIRQNSGTYDEAKDVFQEAMIAIFNQLKEKDIQLEVKFSTYFLSVCLKIWHNRLRKRNSEQKYLYTEAFEIIELHEYDTVKLDEQMKYSLYQKHFQMLKDECKKILGWFLDKSSLKEIAERMGFKSENYAKKRKFYCKEYLVNSIKSDPDYNEIVS
jgi:RNA polymerase sigma factor (sigma-70 family)